MADQEYTYGRANRAWVVGIVSLLIVGASLGLALFFGAQESVDDSGATLEVFCAAGIRPPVAELADQYEREFGVDVRLHYDSSGGLLSQLELNPKGDLYIPADDLYIERARSKNLVAEALPIARFRLVLAVKPGNPKNITSLDDLLADGVNYVICNEQAGVGNKTMKLLQKANRWDEIVAKVKVRMPTVPQAADAVATSNGLDAAFVWDSTAKQYDLDVVTLTEFDEGVADIHVGVLTSTKQSALALRFARYLSAPEKGVVTFAVHKYEPVPGDAWTPTPEIVIFAGGVNRNAVSRTIAEFEEREGCRVNTNYDGCGTLVGKIESSPLKPDTFLTCESSYMKMVQGLFLEPKDVSQTPIVLLVRSDSDKQIRTLQDLTQEGISVGITNPKASALGKLSIDLLQEAGLWDKVERNVRVESPTAHELVLKVEGHDKLDVALVYAANCQNLSPGLTTVPIDHPRAKAVQNIAPGRNTKYPQLVERLIETILSNRSADRFESQGFDWLAPPNGA